MSPILTIDALIHQDELTVENPTNQQKSIIFSACVEINIIFWRMLPVFWRFTLVL